MSEKKAVWEVAPLKGDYACATCEALRAELAKRQKKATNRLQTKVRKLSDELERVKRAVGLAHKGNLAIIRDEWMEEEGRWGNYPNPDYDYE